MNKNIFLHDIKYKLQRLADYLVSGSVYLQISNYKATYYVRQLNVQPKFNGAFPTKF